MKKCGFYIEGLNPERAIDKLVHAGVEVLSAQKPQKNTVVVWVDGKDHKKVFAILKTSCYNIKNVRSAGARRALQACRRAAGLIVGAVFFIACVCFVESRVLKIKVTGSGAYLGGEIENVLRENGTFFFSPVPRNINELTALVMGLPRVTFCSFSHDGGILTVNVEVSDENAVLAGKPLLAPVSGTVERLTVVRGTALCAVGDGVQAGDTLVADYIVSENGTRSVVVIAEAVIAYPVAVVYELPEREALAKAYLDYGEMENIRTSPTEKGTLIQGTARAGAALNLR